MEFLFLIILIILFSSASPSGKNKTDYGGDKSHKNHRQSKNYYEYCEHEHDDYECDEECDY